MTKIIKIEIHVKPKNQQKIMDFLKKNEDILEKCWWTKTEAKVL